MEHCQKEESEVHRWLRELSEMKHELEVQECHTERSEVQLSLKLGLPEETQRLEISCSRQAQDYKRERSEVLHSQRRRCWSAKSANCRTPSSRCSSARNSSRSVRARCSSARRASSSARVVQSQETKESHLSEMHLSLTINGKSSFHKLFFTAHSPQILFVSSF